MSAQTQTLPVKSAELKGNELHVVFLLEPPRESQNGGLDVLSQAKRFVEIGVEFMSKLIIGVWTFGLGKREKRSKT